MRIAILSPINPKDLSEYLYGPEKVKNISCMASSVHSLIKGFLDAGHIVTVITTTAGEKKCIKEYHGKALHVYIIENKFGHGWFGLRLYSRIRRFLHEHIEEFDVIHAQWTYLYAYSILPFVERKPCFCSVRDWCPYQLKMHKALIDKVSWSIRYFFFKNVMDEPKLTKISNSTYTEQCVNSWNSESPKSVLIPNPIKDRLIIDTKKCQVETPTFISIASSLTEPRKNIYNLLAAFQKYHAKHSNSKLILVGRGSKADFEARFSVVSFFDNVTFCGSKSHQEVIDLIDHSSVLVHPSYEETFGNIFLEAAARCVPSIGGKNSGAVPQVLDNGAAGCLCDVSDPNSIYDAMERLIEDNDYYMQMVKNSKARVKDYYSSSKVCESHIRLYQTGGK